MKQNLLAIIALIFIHSAFASTSDSLYIDSVSRKLPSNYFFDKMPNGLEILVIQDASMPIVTSSLVVRNGSMNETADINGVANLYRSMFFKSNREYQTPKMLAKRVAEIGLVYSGAVRAELVTYNVTTASNEIYNGLDFLNNCLRYPNLLKQDFNLVHNEMANEYASSQSDPILVLRDDLYRKLWKNNYCRKNPLGNYNVVMNGGPKEINEVRQKYYYPENSLLIVNGDVKPESVIEKAGAFFGDWERAHFSIPDQYPVPEFDTLMYSTSSISINDIANNPYYMVGFHGPDTRKGLKEILATLILSRVCQLPQSKFQSDLVQSGLSSSASLNYDWCKYVGPIELLVVPNAGKLEPTLNELLKVMNNLNKTDYFTSEQIETAKKMLKAEWAYQTENFEGYSYLLGRLWASGSPFYWSEFISNLDSISASDISSVVNTYITNKPYVVGALASLALKSELEAVFVETKPIDKYINFFNTNTTTITDSANLRVMYEVEYLMKLNPKYKLSVHGYADWTGPEDKNLIISQKRADFVKTYLVSRGVIDASRITAIGHGELPQPENPTEDDKRKQRMVKFSLEQ